VPPSDQQCQQNRYCPPKKMHWESVCPLPEHWNHYGQSKISSVTKYINLSSTHYAKANIKTNYVENMTAISMYELHIFDKTYFIVYFGYLFIHAPTELLIN
jgi:hypothetical protein